MSIKPAQALDGAELQIGDTVRYEGFLQEMGDSTTEGIILRIEQSPYVNMYLVFSATPERITSDNISGSRIHERVNTDYRGMSSKYILALHNASHYEV